MLLSGVASRAVHKNSGWGCSIILVWIELRGAGRRIGAEPAGASTEPPARPPDLKEAAGIVQSDKSLRGVSWEATVSGVGQKEGPLVLTAPGGRGADG